MGLQDRYTGAKAQAYDRVRRASPRWKAEEDAMAAILSDIDGISGARIVDCPCGTGRWYDHLDGVGARVIGVDLSGDMLDEARIKLAETSAAFAAAAELREGSIFELSEVLGADASSVDCVICVRFVNWISLADARRAIASLSLPNAHTLILGASVVPATDGPLAAFLKSARLRWKNTRRRGQPDQHVHSEAALLGLLAENGWQVRERHFIFRNETRENVFYHCAREA